MAAPKDDLHTLADVLHALGEDARFAGYQVRAAALSPSSSVGPAEGVDVTVGPGAVRLVEAAALDPAALEAQLAQVRGGGGRLILLGNEEQLRAAAADHADASEVSLLVLPISRARLAVTLPAELDLVTLRAQARERARAADRYRYELSELLAISRAISSERDVVALLGLILEKSRYVTGADAGSIYIVEGLESQSGRTLRFMVSQNDSLPVDFRAFTLPVDDRSIVGKAALNRAVINIPDLYRLDEPGGNPWGVQHNRSLDDRSGYRTHSMLCVPLVNQHDDVIGVVQLINRKRDPRSRLASEADFEEQVIPFDQRAAELCETLAAQAGVSLENAMLTDEIQQLFEGFVNASVTAIESRDPTTSGHSQRVATLTCNLARAVDRVDAGPLAVLRFTPEDLKQIEYAGLLHDFGKVGVREKVLVKANKLYEHERDLVLQRFDYIRKSIEADCLRRALERGGRGPASASPQPGELDDEARAAIARLDEVTAFILRANEPTIHHSAPFDRLHEIAALRFVDPRGESRPYLTAPEIESLSITRGSLTLAERREIESHVLHTFNFLATIPWGRKLNRIPQIAGTHHERLDGTGYPWGLGAAEIPVEARMMQLADIFDALTASDRPYKRAVPIDAALGILESEVKAGKCDGALFGVFAEAQVWDGVIRRP